MRPMIRMCTICILSLSLSIFVSHQVYAQPAAKNGKTAESTAKGPRRHLANIVMAGLAGAVLGLSTLSFYGRPQDRLVNIPVGFAIGVIVGTVYTTYRAAAEPREFYSDLRVPQPELWAAEDAQKFRPPDAKMQSIFRLNF